MKKLLRRIRQILRDRRTRRFFKRFVGTFAAIVVFVTTYALVLPAITMEAEAQCGIEAHQHDDSCFEEVLVCDLPESDGHQHVDSCYEKVLVCRKESHTHSPACYRSDFYGDTAESTAVSGAESAAAVAGNTSVTATPTDEIIEGEYSEDEVIEEAGAAAPAADAETEITEDINDYTNTEESSAEASLSSASSGTSASESSGESTSESSDETASAFPGETVSSFTGETASVSSGEAVSSSFAASIAADDSDTNTGDTDTGDTDTGDTYEENTSAQEADKTKDADIESDSDESATDDQAEKMALLYPALTFQDSIAASMGTLPTDTGSEKATALPDQTELTVHVEADEGAFPEGTTMRLSAAEDMDAVASAVEEAVTADDAVSNKTRGFHAVDISFWNNEGVEIEPLKPIRVSITSESIKQAVEDTSTAPVVVHVTDKVTDQTSADTTDAVVENNLNDSGEKNTESIPETEENLETSETKKSADENADHESPVATIVETEKQTEAENGRTIDTDTLTFEAGAFSVYAIVYTVDFEYSVNGKMYQFSLPGGEKIALSDLIEVLGILGDTYSGEKAAFDSVDAFLKEVAKVEFSDESLVKVTQNEEDNDWTLESLKPFDTEESLTITMKNGDVITVKVTDAQISTHVITADGEDYLITVTYGPEAGIPDGTQLQVDEYTDGDETYQRYYELRKDGLESVSASDFSRFSNKTKNLLEDEYRFEPAFSDELSYDCESSVSEDDKAFAIEQMSNAIPLPEMTGYVLFDISLVYQGEVIEPKSKVNVCIEYQGKDMLAADAVSVGHYENSGNMNEPDAGETEKTMPVDEKKLTEMVLTDYEVDSESVKVSFSTESFSLYDVAGIQWTANASKTVYFALKTGMNQILDIDQHGVISVKYSDIENMSGAEASSYIQGMNDYQAAEPIVIYNKSGDTFYAIDGDGNLAKVYESGDTVMWNGQPSIGWKLIRYMNDAGEYTGYYDFINMETGKFLTPSLISTVGTNRISVQLDGAGSYSSTIKSWDNNANAYMGYSINNDQLTTSSSEEWYFAAVSQTVSDDLKLQTVDTVDSRSLGITIKMFDYDNTCNKNNRSQEQTSYQIFNSDGLDWLNDGSVIQGLVKNRLNSEGYPETTYANTNLKGLFTNGTDANKLFMLDTYQETGYFEYSSFQNFAHLNSNGDFTVYRQVGVEDTAKTPVNKTYGNATGTYYFNRGNFLPYNTIADYKTAVQKYGSSGVTNRYDENGNLLDNDDPRKGENLFLTQETVDYFFGMSMEADFYQPAGGKNNGQDIIYEFNGDDDLWIYVDNVLVLDIGGCHHAHSGTINFTTGKVEVVTGRGTAETTIRQCFKNAGIFPDGTTWVESKADQYFSGDTFADYSQHNMKMFYMERGAGASNLHIKFNLPVIKDAGKLIVDKVVSGTVNEKYSNDKFAFQVIKVNGNTETRFTSAVYDSNGQPVEYKHEVEIDGVTYNDVFYLRPGEAAVFDVADNTQQYYVKELGIDTGYYDRVLINREESTVTNGIAQSTVSSVKNRNRVTYDNHGVTEDLRIKKIVEGDVKNSSDTFEFYVYLTGQNNELIPYSNGEYYVLDPDGNYCTYVNGLPVGDSTITEETRTAYESGQWGTIGSIPDGYTVLIPDLLVGTDFLVSEREDRMPTGYEFKSIGVVEGTADSVNITGYSNTTAGDSGAIVIGSYSYPNHTEGKLKKDTYSDATVIVTNQAANKLTVNKTWQTNDYVTTHGPVKFALYKLVNGNEVLVEDSVKTLNAPDLTMEYRISGNLGDYVVREVVVATDGSGMTVTPVANNGVVEVSGETTTLGDNMTDTYIVAYQQGEATETSRTDTVINKMPKLTINKKDMGNGRQLADAEFILTGEDGETALTGYENLKSDSKTSGNLLDGICLSNGTYYLVETKAPAGYNGLSYKIKIVVNGDNSKIFTASTVPESTTLISDQTPDDNMLYTFNVFNNPGVELPSTGGPGTRLFTILGSILILGAGVLLWRRRRLI